MKQPLNIASTPISPRQEIEQFNSGNGSANHKIRLTDFIRQNMEQIVSEWEAFAHTLLPAANHMTPLALRNHIHELLDFIVTDIKSSQTSLEQIRKSQGGQEKRPTPSAAETHAALRLAGGFDIEQMVSEYRALRASVIRLWSIENVLMDSADIIDLTQFNEAIDQELAESVSHYTRKVNYSKDLFMGILSHDLRNPLNAISMSVQLIQNLGGLKERQSMLAAQAFESTVRITAILDDLLDVTRARFGSQLPVIRAPMDMGYVSHQMVDEFRVAEPSRTIALDVSGDVKGEWDKARIGQVFSNLLGNAIQYSFKDSPIGVTVKGTSQEVVLSVHNYGVPIPAEKIAAIFDSLTRVSSTEEDHNESINLGLGLFITRDIVNSHGGTIDVISSEEDGTIFTARFPHRLKQDSRS